MINNNNNPTKIKNILRQLRYNQNCISMLDNSISVAVDNKETEIFLDIVTATKLLRTLCYLNMFYTTKVSNLEAITEDGDVNYEMGNY